MNKKSYIHRIVHRFIFLLPICLLGVGCDYLDVVPDNVEDLSYAFRDREKAQRYLYTCYNSLPSPLDNLYDPGFYGGGEITTPKNVVATAQLNYNGLGVLNAKQSVSSPIHNYWDGMNGAGCSLYNAIRECNIFIERIDDVYDVEPYEKTRWKAEAKTLKAFYHFYLMRMYGAIIIMDKNLPTSAAIEEMHMYRNTFDDCVTYVRNLLDEAAEDLPEIVQTETTELGRITKPIALAIKAKLMVMSASPLFNGNADISHLVDNKGVALFNSEYQQSKWAMAAEACEEAINAAHQAGFKLYDSYSNNYQLNDTLDHQLMLRQIIFDSWNKEQIWGATNLNYWNLQSYALPTLKTNWFNTNNVRSSLNATFAVAEYFHTKNGVPMDEDKTYPYDERFTQFRTATDQDRWYIRKGRETIEFHFDREPRFYSTLGFDGGLWWGNGSITNGATTTNYNNIHYTPMKAKETAGKRAAYNYSVTGYFAKKLVNFRTTVTDDATAATLSTVRTSFPLIRLADLYLLYAEALNESQDGFNASVFTYVDRVRERAGLNGVMQSWSTYSRYGAPATKDAARKIIQQERLIELAFEGQNVWDIRRWKRGIEMLSGPVFAWNIDGETNETFYRRNIADMMYFTTKDYLFPIREHNLIVNKNLVQNPGW